mgnify:CR=1 FL=1
MNLETKIAIYKFTPQVFTLTRFFIYFLTFFKHHSKSLKKSPTIRNNVNIRWNVHLKKEYFSLYSFR